VKIIIIFFKEGKKQSTVSAGGSGQILVSNVAGDLGQFSY
jgi:hypothetical protein